MPQVIGDALGIKKIVILNVDVSAACGVKDGSGKASFARKPLRHLPAPLRITAAFLAATWASETQGFHEARHAQADALVSARDLTAALIGDVGGAARDRDVEVVQANRGGDKSVRLAQATTGDTQELQQALEQEHHKTETLARELAGARRGLEWLLMLLNRSRDESARIKQAAESEVAELRKALQEQRDQAGRLTQQSENGAEELRRSMLRNRAERLERDLAIVRRDVEPRVSPAAKAGDDATQLKQAESGAAELRKSLQQERERAERLEQDLAAARRDVEKQTALAARANDETTRLKQASESVTAELRKSLQQERERAERLERDFATVRRDAEAQTALAARANDEATQLKQAAESGTDELRKILQQENDRAEALAQDLSMARTKIDAYEAQARKASDQAAALKQATESEAVELRKSLQQERERAARLEQNLAAARRDVETQTALASKASDEAAWRKQVAESGSADLRRSLQQERDKAARLERDLALERNTKNAPAVPAVVTAGQVTEKHVDADVEKPVAVDQTTVADARGATPPNPEDAVEVARLVARAGVLLGQGDIGSARIVLERAAETGSAQASFTLAETYDPLILPKWGTYGTRGDATKARDLYAKAEAGGIKEAKERFEALRQ
jgi:hypothetical protein